MAGGLFEKISAGAITPEILDCNAVIINLNNSGALLDALKKLNSRLKYKVFIVNSTEKKLPQVLKKCTEAGIPAIVYGGEFKTISANMLKRKCSATMVSSGYFDDDELCNMVDSFMDSDNLEEFSLIGYQGYLTDDKILNKLHDKYFQEMRLGTIRDNLSLCEPMLRDCNVHLFNLNSIRFSDFPHESNSNPNGLYAEEACSIARYMGLGMNLSEIYLYGMNAEENNNVCNNLAAQIIWHICEGIQTNIKENPYDFEKESQFLRKIVNLGENGDEITFINSATTDRWWMEIPIMKSGNNKMVPCSVTDYKAACNGELPMKWLFFYQKYSLL